MTIVRVRPVSAIREAWQLTEVNFDTRPQWTLSWLRCRDGEYLLNRRAGAQVICVGEWLVRDLDGEPEWLTDKQFRRKYEVVGRVAS